MKNFFIFLLTLSLILLSQPSLAFDSTAIVNLQAPYSTIYGATFDNLVMDFSLLTTKTDVVKAIALRNLGTANYLSHIKYLTLWTDDGPGGFQGLGIDKEVGKFVFSTTYQSWYLENLSLAITDDLRFFITVESYSSITKTGTIQLQIPPLTDNNANGSFDVGDFGIFMDSGDNGPVGTAITNDNSQVFSTMNVDSIGPKIVLTNLFEGDVISSNNYMIQGLVKDQGNSYIPEMKIFINSQESVVQEMDFSLNSWRYDWQNISDGAYSIRLQAKDGWGNLTQTPAINVTVSNQVLSLTNSTVTVDKTTLINDGLDPANVTVTLKDQNNQPIKNRAIEIQASSDLIISISNYNSDNSGQVKFQLRCATLGAKTAAVTVSGQVLKTINLTISTAELVGIGITFGDLIKASTPAIYYYGADGKRYVFPNQAVYSSWYGNFNNVKTITDSQLAMITIGGNVTYKPGVKMVKIQTDPRVYAVAAGGTLRWIQTESLAITLYGNDWATKVADVSDVFFANYKSGNDIALPGDFNPASVSQIATSINADKGLLK